MVKLFGVSLACTTKSDGTYLLSGQTDISMPGYSSKVDAISISCRNNSFVFNAPSSLPAAVRLYDLRGRMVAQVFCGILRPGSTKVPFPKNVSARAMLILRVSAGTSDAEYTLVPAAGGSYRLHAGGLTEGKLSKTAAVDWLQASKTGYASSIQTIDAYTGVVNFTLGTLVNPDFGSNVYVFDPSMASIQTIMDGLNSSTAQFSTQRTAYLFKPGNYSVTVTCNYYIQAYGMGMSPEDVQITGAVQSLTGGLSAFWRGAEGFSVTPTGGTDTWGVSQADPFRRMHIKGQLALSNGGSSGGFMADCKIDGAINPGSQQQFYFRNNTLGGWSGGNWNMLFQGCDNPPAENFPGGPITVAAKTPLVREKPYLVFDASGNYSVFVPALRTNSQGTTWLDQTPSGESLPIDQFYVALSAIDNATTINAALAQGKNLLLTPGIYSVDAPIFVQRPGTVVLGLGMATLKPNNGVIALQTTDAGGIIIANILFDAGTVSSPALLQLGDSGSVRDNSASPPLLFDIFARIGGAGAAQANTAVIINSNNTILDHCWLWRADHGAGAGWTTNPAQHGLIVNGNNVITYGQQVEHFQDHLTVWNGNNGQTYFYQSELPYDVPTQAAFMTGTEDGIAAYYVTSGVTNFTGWSLGIYSYFNKAPIIETNAMEVPRVSGIKIHHVVTYSLGNDQGQITHVVNDTGATAKWGATPMIRFGDYVGH
ncbi:MAG TPA: coagulation factor 5/8 type domain-containing protein [Chitinivibrionales bacterium]|nr:coagulation factor 5/8 type domain-containing protein [Chitinivibrionales bacterium]